MTTGTLPGVADSTDGGGHHRTAGRDARLMIVLDADLPPPTTMSGLVGLDQLTTINRAVGMLIDQGHHPNTRTPHSSAMPPRPASNRTGTPPGCCDTRRRPGPLAHA